MRLNPSVRLAVKKIAGRSIYACVLLTIPVAVLFLSAAVGFTLSTLFKHHADYDTLQITSSVLQGLGAVAIESWLIVDGIKHSLPDLKKMLLT